LKDSDDIDVLHPIDGVFVDLGAVKPTPPQMVIPNLIPVGMTFLAGPPKCGKSLITLAAAAIVADIPCQVLPPHLSVAEKTGTVQIYSFEATADELKDISQEGLKVNVPANESILVADDPWLFRLDTDEGQKKLFHWLEARPPRLLVIDPLRNFHSQDENDSGAMVNLLGPLRKWAVEHKAACLVVHHTSKPGADQKEYDAQNMRGTGALFGMCDGVLIVTPKGEFGRMLVKATFKRAKSWESTLQLSVYGEQGAAREEISDLDKEVLELLKGGEHNIDKLRAQLHVGKAKVVESLDRLDRAGLARKMGRLWVPKEK
jgi:hypothetical protein